jgi:lipopolysaccharide/colanic/teichoic acid biosynthesis glycosyltransferase
MNPIGRGLKRGFDIIVSLMILLPFSPVLLAGMLAVWLGDRQNVFYRQERVTLGGRSFRILKLRTMRIDAEKGGAVWAAQGDNRVTPVGRFLRRTRIDELPQLFNVLAGQMSIVGPRPHAPASRAEEWLFWAIDQRYWQRHSIRPGITGLAQVRGLRGATERRTDLERRLYADLEYVANWSLLNDLCIVGRTFSVLLHRNAF